MRGPSRILAPVGTLSLREASTKFGIPPRTLTDWVNAGMIRIAQKPERRGQPLLLMEKDVAELAENYTPGRGRKRGGRASLLLRAS